MSTSRSQSRSSNNSKSASIREKAKAKAQLPSSRRPWSGRNAPEACASTASYLLYAQDTSILIVHHDTLAVERRFELHQEEVLWIVVDNVSEKGAGRTAVSFDSGKTAIVWDILTGSEISRFTAYEYMKVASFIRNGNIAFGNDQGNIILYEAKTSEHVSARTIFDPITAIAPASDCRTFAVGYQNGSILITTLQPSFTILHTLNTSRAPSRIAGLAWHGSSSKQKSEMLATMSQDGDLRVWSIPKAQHSEAPAIIRTLAPSRSQMPGKSVAWFAWSKMGRLIQHIDGETKAWDVRTKRVTYDHVPTTDGVVAITNYGPTATLFTLGPDHTVQQYDVSPTTAPLQVNTARHAPIDRLPNKLAISHSNSRGLGTDTATGSETDDSRALSPLEKIAKVDTLDAIASELRDTLGPLSPTAYDDSLSSHSSTKGRRTRKYLYDYPSSRGSTASGYDGTEFSFGLASRPGTSHSRQRSSTSRHGSFRTAEELRGPGGMDLFPYVKERLANVPFRSPHYGEGPRTPDLLLREMLSVVFGWNDDIRTLISDELAHHPAGSASAVLLARWLGDIGADHMNSLIGSESMTSSDWMLLALSSIGADSQKKVGEAFVQRLLEINDVHPAVAILLGLGEYNDAIEVYVSQSYFLEAVILTCLTLPSDWGRVAHLLRRWGEAATKNGDAGLAVRCFSCTAVETSVPWRSPSAQDAVFNSRQAHLTRPPSADIISPTLSIPSRTGSGRLKNPALKLITSFGERGLPIQQLTEDQGATRATTALTPFSNSAMPTSALPLSALPKSGAPMSPGAVDAWRFRTMRDPSSARTATPGGYTRRRRLPSRSEIERAKQEAAALITPLQGAADAHARTDSRTTATPQPTTAIEPVTAVRPTRDSEGLAITGHDQLPTPGRRETDPSRETYKIRNKSKDRKHPGLAVDVQAGPYFPSPHPDFDAASLNAALQSGTLSPPLTGDSSKARGIEKAAGQLGTSNGQGDGRHRGDSRKREPRSARARDQSGARSKSTQAIKPAKRSPSSPVPMSPEEIAKASYSQRTASMTTDEETFYRIGLTSPVESQRSARTTKSESKIRHRRGLSEGPTSASDKLDIPKLARSLNRKNSPDPLMLSVDDARGRSEHRLAGSSLRSPSLPILSSKRYDPRESERSGLNRSRSRRAQSNSRKASEDKKGLRAGSSKRDRSASRKRAKEDAVSSPTQVMRDAITEEGDNRTNLALDHGASEISSSHSMLSDASSSANVTGSRSRGLSRKELAARELVERRKSLARRPSAPLIPLPGEELGFRPFMPPRSNTDLGESPISLNPAMPRSSSVDPDQMSKHAGFTGTSTTSAPIGLPATPRAMRHPRYMNSEEHEHEGAPPVPDIPGMYSDVGSLSGGSSMLSQTTSSIIGGPASSMLSGAQRSDPGRLTNSSFVSSATWSSYKPGSDPGKLQFSSQVSSAPSNIHRYDMRSSLNPSDLSSLISNSSHRGVPLPRSPSAPLDPESLVHPLYRSGAVSNRNGTARPNIKKIVPSEVSDASDGVIVVGGIDAALRNGDDPGAVIVVPEYAGTTILPELQHLAGVPVPPPPPPAPPQTLPSSVLPPIPASKSGVINIAIDGARTNSALDTQAAALTSADPAAVSPGSHRRNTPSGNESLGSRIRGIGERIRSSSKSRTKSPSIDQKPLPYETALPRSDSYQLWQGLAQRAPSPYEQDMAAQARSPRSPSADLRAYETTIPPSSLPASRSTGVSNASRSAHDPRTSAIPPVPSYTATSTPGGFL